MSDEEVIKNCSPTLAGIKTGNLFSSCFSSKEEMLQSVRCLNVRLRDKGVRVIPLRLRQGRGLIYVYRESKLKKNISDPKVRSLLEARGYNCQATGKCLAELKKHLENENDFPHEMGKRRMDGHLGRPCEGSRRSFCLRSCYRKRSS